jgi:hypothetical protein
MHTAAFDFVMRVAQSLPPLPHVLEFGSREWNGSVREIFTDARWSGGYVGVDLAAGAGVEIVGDAATVQLPGLFNAVVCCEVFEHTNRMPAICTNAYRHLRPGGVMIVTCATDPRKPHGACGANSPAEGEYYANVPPGLLSHCLLAAGFAAVLLDQKAPPGDLYALALKRR